MVGRTCVWRPSHRCISVEVGARISRFPALKVSFDPAFQTRVRRIFVNPAPKTAYHERRGDPLRSQMIQKKEDTFNPNGVCERRDASNLGHYEFITAEGVPREVEVE